MTKNPWQFCMILWTFVVVEYRSRLVSLCVVILGSILIVICLVLSAGTLLDPPRVLPSSAYIPPFAFALLLLTWPVKLINTSISGSGRRKKWQRGDLYQNLERVSNRLIWCFFIPFAVGVFDVGIGFLLGNSGQPEYDKTTGQYEINNHGTISIVSKAKYLYLLAHGSRIFLGAALLMTAFAVPISLNHWRARSLTETDPTENPHL